MSGVRRNVFVLSAGGARRAAQVGMLRTLLGAGIVPHAFVGCSVGALNAAWPPSTTSTAWQHWNKPQPNGSTLRSK